MVAAPYHLALLMNRTRLLASLLLITTASGLDRADAQTGGPAGFRTWLWVHGDHPKDAALGSALKDLGFHGVSVEPDEDVSRLSALDIPWYVDQFVGKGVLAVREAAWDRARKAEPGTPTATHRESCLNDGAVLETAGASIARRLERLHPHVPAFISLRDEPSFTLRLNPMDWCHAPGCRQGFRTFLKERWGSLDNAARGWGLPVDSIPSERPSRSDAPPPWSDRALTNTDRARDLLFHRPSNNRDLVAWNDIRVFNDRTFARSIHELASVVRNEVPGVPVGILGGQMPHAFGGFDWERLLPTLGVAEVYDAGGARALMGSLAGGASSSTGTRFLSTLIPEPGRPAGAAAHEAWHRFLGGDHELVIYSSRAVFEDGDSGAPTPWAVELAPELKLMQADEFAPWHSAKQAAPQVAVLFSMPSVRLNWLLDTRRDGLSWINRSTSYELANSTQARNREAWIALLEDLGLSYGFVTPAQVAEGRLRSGGYRGLVLPRSIALSENEVAEIIRFNRDGGLVVADCQPGLYTGRMVRRQRPALDELLGIDGARRHLLLNGDRISPRARKVGLPYPVAEAGIEPTRATARNVNDGVPTVMTHRTGDNGGQTAYLNLLVMEYAQARLDVDRPRKAQWLRDQLGAVFHQAGIRPRCRLERRVAPGSKTVPHWPIGVAVRTDSEGMLVAVHLNALSGAAAVPWTQLMSSPALPITLQMDGTWTASLLATGEVLGSANHFNLRVGPKRPVVLRLRP